MLLRSRRRLPDPSGSFGVGARTVSPRQHGGNCDIKDLSRGSKIYFPVYMPGAGLSMGDLHFSQGDGETTFCGAIEMAGSLHIKVDVIKDSVAKYGIKNPVFKPSPITPNYNDYLIFEGISVDEAGKQHYLDVHIAYQQAFCMPSDRRKAHATNERSANAPKTLGECKASHGSGCSCCSKKPSRLVTKTKSGAKGFPTSRPWMISH